MGWSKEKDKKQRLALMKNGSPGKCERRFVRLSEVEYLAPEGCTVDYSGLSSGVSGSPRYVD